MKAARILLFLLPALLCAAPVKLTRAEVRELFDALSAIDAGLSVTNTMLAADAINALQPAADALRKAGIAAERELKTANDARALAILAEFDALAATSDTYELPALKLSGDEIAAARIRPKQLATFKRLLPAAK